MDQRVLQLVAKLLQSGMPEEQIISKLVEGGIPQEMAQQAIQEAKGAMGGPREAGHPEGAASNSQGMAMMRQVLTQVPPKVVLFIIEAIMKMKGSELNALVQDLKQADDQAPTQEGQDQGQGSPAGQQQQQQQELQI